MFCCDFCDTTATSEGPTVTILAPEKIDKQKLKAVTKIKPIDGIKDILININFELVILKSVLNNYGK